VPSRNGDSHPAVQDALRLMRRARSVPESARQHLVREQRKRAVARIMALRQKRGNGGVSGREQGR
jgi:hypothetical protein